MALVVCAAAVRAYTTSEPSAVLLDAPRALHAPTVASLTEQQASSRATIKYIDAEPSLPEAHLVQVAQEDDAAAPSKKRTLVCEAANKVLSSDEWCGILCEKNTTSAFTTLELRTNTHPATLHVSTACQGGVGERGRERGLGQRVGPGGAGRGREKRSGGAGQEGAPHARHRSGWA